jgi:hypothetical protein
MTTAVRLDPDRMAGLEPSEGDEREQIMLSPFAVPREITIGKTAQGVVSFLLAYSGGERGAYTEPLDDVGNPRVSMTVSNSGQKVIEMTFDPAASLAEMHKIADRLERRTVGIAHPAKRLSYHMTANVIRKVVIPLLAGDAK